MTCRELINNLINYNLDMEVVLEVENSDDSYKIHYVDIQEVYETSINGKIIISEVEY